jgi:Holliday junction DNA helicase RuvA
LEGIVGDGLRVGVGGIVFHVTVSASVLAAAPSRGQSVYLHTFLYLREDNVALYGFSSEAELGLFRTLLGVTGVGPRLALALLSALGPERLATAVGQRQIEVLSAVPGVGKRTAERLIVELKGKLAIEAEGAAPVGVASVASQTFGALTNLGYTVAEAQEAWRSLTAEQQANVEQALRACLGYLADR